MFKRALSIFVVAVVAIVVSDYVSTLPIVTSQPSAWKQRAIYYSVGGIAAVGIGLVCGLHTKSA